MRIVINPPVALHEKGRRPKNEDSIYPKAGTATANNQVFLVCDGVGGAAKGEIASLMVADAFGTAFESTIANGDNLNTVLISVQDQFDQYLLQNEHSKGMGTTLTFLQFNESGVTIAHAGDSRVYHVRKNDVLFCTYDHSLINDLKKNGMFEEAKTAQSNIITRAIQGSSIKKIELDVHNITNIEAGDYFLLCSDGVWGVLTDEELTNILQEDISDFDKLSKIEGICAESSKDNYTAYLIQIEAVEDGPALPIVKSSDATLIDLPQSTTTKNELNTTISREEPTQISVEVPPKISLDAPPKISIEAPAQILVENTLMILELLSLKGISI